MQTLYNFLYNADVYTAYSLCT